MTEWADETTNKTHFCGAFLRYSEAHDALYCPQCNLWVEGTRREAGMLDGNELIYNMHKALKDYRFAFSDENRTVMILER